MATTANRQVSRGIASTLRMTAKGQARLEAAKINILDYFWEVSGSLTEEQNVNSIKLTESKGS